MICPELSARLWIGFVKVAVVGGGKAKCAHHSVLWPVRTGSGCSRRASVHAIWFAGSPDPDACEGRSDHRAFCTGAYQPDAGRLEGQAVPGREGMARQSSASEDGIGGQCPLPGLANSSYPCSDPRCPAELRVLLQRLLLYDEVGVSPQIPAVCPLVVVKATKK